RAGFKDVAETFRWYRDNSVLLEEAEKMAVEELTSKIVVGEYVDRKIPTFTETLFKTIREAKKSAKTN
ncbi:2-oxoacid:ferredoxin oxidoreductase subunit beta, partial [Candidatus Bathyarchaeota archaeon]|nr:2-oxoacid:ferredoxin oxidoreductase subunit beta [Candidatus Bathyarchaeota archaeon]